MRAMTKLLVSGRPGRSSLIVGLQENFGKRVVKSPKYYFTETGLLCQCGFGF